MGVFFAESATKSQKFGISVVIFVVLLSIFGIFNQTLVNEWVMKAAAIVSVLLSLVCIPLVVRTVLNAHPHKYAESRWKRWRMIAGFAFFVWVFLYTALARGLPILCHYFVASWGEITVTVRHKASGYKTRHCSTGSITVMEYNPIFNGELCGFREFHWEQFKRGDKLILQGKKSSLGFSFKRYGLIADGYRQGNERD